MNDQTFESMKKYMGTPMERMLGVLAGIAGLSASVFSTTSTLRIP